MESQHNCLDNSKIEDDGYVDPARKVTSFQGAHPLNGFGPYLETEVSCSKNCCKSDNAPTAVYISSPIRPAVTSEASQDSGFLSTPSCDSVNCVGATRKTTLSSFGSITSDAGCDYVDHSALQGNSIDITVHSDRLPYAQMIYLSEEHGKNQERQLVSNSDDFPHHEIKSTGISDSTNDNVTELETFKCPWKDQSDDHNYLKYSCLWSGLGVKNRSSISIFGNSLAEKILKDALMQSISMVWNIQCSGQCSEVSCQEDRKRNGFLVRNKICKPTTNGSGISCSSNLCWTPELPYSPHHSRPSRLSSVSYSHDSLVISQLQDDSRFIKEAVSHEVLSSSAKKRRFKTFEPEIYSCPVDTLRPLQRRIFQPKAIVQQPRSGFSFKPVPLPTDIRNTVSKYTRRKKNEEGRVMMETNGNGMSREEDGTISTNYCNGDATHKKSCSKSKGISGHDDHKLCKINPFCANVKKKNKEEKKRHRRSFSSNIRNAIIAIFTFRRTPKELGSCVNAENDFIDPSRENSDSTGGIKWGKICPLPSAAPLRHSNKCSAFTNPTPFHNDVTSNQARSSVIVENRQRQHSLLFCLGHPRTNSFVDEPLSRSYRRKSSHSPLKQNASKRALPPLPNDVNLSSDKKTKRDEEGCDFASIIEKVKDYGWYWGPISGEAAEKVLSNEPDGSFIVRDSSDYHYIFSLTFRLNGVTRHVRIEHDQGNFSFGGFTRFKSQTIVDFIENAVEHSRSGRYLFFLHRRPVLGPMRVQLLHPVSRFKHVQSLQHLCRFAIVNHVRRDLINSLPLPQRLKEYLSSPHYYSELVERCMSNDADEPDLSIDSPESCTVGGEATESEILGAAALSPSEPINLLPKKFSYQFVHEDNRSKFNASLEYEQSESEILPPCIKTPTLLAEQMILPGTPNEHRNSWRKSLECQITSFYSSQSSYQFSTTASENSPENANRETIGLLSTRKLLKCVSLGNIRKPSRKSAYICNNLMAALALETNNVHR